MGNISVGEPVDNLACELSRIIMRMGRVLRSNQVSAVSHPQISALMRLYEQGPLTPGALALYEQVKPPSMTRVLGLLEGSGLVERVKHPTDGRQAIVTISAEGQALLVAEGSTREKWLQEKLDGLSAEDRESLRSAARILAELAAD